MNIQPLVVGPFDVNCLILHGTANRVLIVDPGEDADRIAETLRSQSLQVTAYLLTHGHADHLGALAALTEQFPAPVLVHAADAAWAFSPVNQIPPYYGVPAKPAAGMLPVSGESTRTDAGLTYRIIPTPGHTPGCVCYYFPADKVMITGDTLFAGGAGRTDLPGGSTGTLQASLRHLRSFADDTCIYPGHGPSSTLGEEKRTNVFMQ